MSCDPDGSPCIACRCRQCGYTVLADAPSPAQACPKCGGTDSEQVQLTSGAIGYSLADRTRGPDLEDGRLGCMAFFHGWMSREQVVACVALQRQAIERGERAPRFGEVAVSAGLLTDEQVDALLRMQAIHRPAEYENKFGAIAVRKGFVTQDQIDQTLAEQMILLHENNEAPALGILLMEKKLLTAGQVKEIIDQQELPPGEETAPAEAQEAEPPEGPDRRAEVLLAPPEEGETRFLCRCGECGKVEIRERWRAGNACPECGSDTFAPVPVLHDALQYSLADRRLGPVIEDGRLGCMAYFAGWMTEPQIRKCLDDQKSLAREGKPVPKFGELAVSKGILTEEQVSALLRIQAIHRPIGYDRTFGAIAVRAGYATQKQVDRALAEQERLLREQREAPMLGILMTEMKLLNTRQVKAILTYQSRYGQGALAELMPPVAAGEETKLERAVHAVTSQKGLLATLGSALLLVAVVMMVTGWFGLFKWEAPDTIVGCKQCERVFAVPAVEGARCPRCGREYSISPLVRCSNCGRVYLYGAIGSGTKCPECASRRFEPIKKISEGGEAWKRPPLPDEEDASP